MPLGDFTNNKSDKDRIDDLERRIKELEDRAAKQTPWWHPDTWPVYPNQPWKLPEELGAVFGGHGAGRFLETVFVAFCATLKSMVIFTAFPLLKISLIDFARN